MQHILPYMYVYDTLKYRDMLNILTSLIYNIIVIYHYYRMED